MNEHQAIRNQLHIEANNESSCNNESNLQLAKSIAIDNSATD